MILEEVTEEDVIGFDPLYESMMKCRKGVMWKDSTAGYVLRGVEKTERLCEELHDGSYQPRPPKRFRISHPKPRSISSVAFRDRVYQRSLNDNLVYPAMVRSFIHDNFACQTGKGTDPARERLKEFLRRYYRKHGPEGWVLQIDVHGYYPNMRHDVVEEMFRKKLPEWAFLRVRRILREQYGGEKGYDPGSQLVQIAGISLLDDLDHYCKERLHLRYYLRYMDDIPIIHPDRAYLEFCREEIGRKLREKGLEYNPEKTRIYPLREGIPFLGFRFRITETGKVIMLIDPGRVKAQRKKLRRLAAKSRRGEIPRGHVDQSFEAWKNHAGKGSTKKVIQRMEKFYNDLWRESQW